MNREKRLFEASLEGSVTTLKLLIQEDPLILERIPPLSPFSRETPLHVAVLRGHLEFARVVLSHNPKLATESDWLGNSPLHLASVKGHVAIARELIHVGPAACLAGNKEGFLPLHLAIMKGGRVELVRELTRACPESTQSRLDRGESVYHLCVKYNNLEALQVLVEELVDESDDGNNNNLLNARDDDGNTILHLATFHKHFEIIRYLMTRTQIELNAENNNGLTPLDLIGNSPRDLKALEILNFLLESSHAQKASDKASSPSEHKPPSSAIARGLDNPTRSRRRAKSWARFFTFSDDNKHLEKIRGEILIVSAIIVIVNVLPIINMESNGPVVDDELNLSAASLVPALTIMVLLGAGVSLRNNLCAFLVVQLMYTSLGFLGNNFYVSAFSKEVYLSVAFVLLCVWSGLLILASALNVVRLAAWLLSCIDGCVKRRKLKESGLSN